MKPIISNILALSIFSASSALAASGAENDGNGLFLSLFIGFAVVIIAFQFLPGVLMFFGMAKGLIGSAAKDEENARKTTTG